MYIAFEDLYQKWLNWFLFIILTVSVFHYATLMGYMISVALFLVTLIYARKCFSTTVNRYISLLVSL